MDSREDEESYREKRKCKLTDEASRRHKHGLADRCRDDEAVIDMMRWRIGEVGIHRCRNMKTWRDEYMEKRRLGGIENREAVRRLLRATDILSTAVR